MKIDVGPGALAEFRRDTVDRSRDALDEGLPCAEVVGELLTIAIALSIETFGPRSVAQGLIEAGSSILRDVA